MTRTRRPKVHSARLGSIYIKPEWQLMLNEYSRNDGRTINELVREALKDYFKKRGTPVE